MCQSGTNELWTKGTLLFVHGDNNTEKYKNAKGDGLILQKSQHKYN